MTQIVRRGDDCRGARHRLEGEHRAPPDQGANLRSMSIQTGGTQLPQRRRRRDGRCCREAATRLGAKRMTHRAAAPSPPIERKAGPYGELVRRPHFSRSARQRRAGQGSEELQVGARRSRALTFRQVRVGATYAQDSPPDMLHAAVVRPRGLGASSKASTSVCKGHPRLESGAPGQFPRSSSPMMSGPRSRAMRQLKAKWSRWDRSQEQQSLCSQSAPRPSQRRRRRAMSATPRRSTRQARKTAQGDLRFRHTHPPARSDPPVLRRWTRSLRTASSPAGQP